MADALEHSLAKLRLGQSKEQMLRTRRNHIGEEHGVIEEDGRFARGLHFVRLHVFVTTRKAHLPRDEHWLAGRKDVRIRIDLIAAHFDVHAPAQIFELEERDLARALSWSTRHGSVAEDALAVTLDHASELHGHPIRLLVAGARR